MLFKLTKTDNWGNEEVAPHKKAFKKRVPMWHERSCTEEEFNTRYSSRQGLWRDKGTNHTVTADGKGIIRQQGYELVWVISIPDLAALTKLLREVGQCVLTPGNKHHMASIEIYNGYRE